MSPCPARWCGPQRDVAARIATSGDADGSVAALPPDRPRQRDMLVAVGRLRPHSALARAARAVGDAVDPERRNRRRCLHEAAIRLARHAELRAQAPALQEHGVAQHVRRARRGLRDDVVLADLEPGRCAHRGCATAFPPHTAQYSSPRCSTLKLTTFSGSTPCTLRALCSQGSPSKFSPYTSSPSQAPRSSASLQCVRRSCPAAVSDHGREPSRFGPQRSWLQPPFMRAIAGAHRLITTAPSDLRTPLQLLSCSGRKTPRAWNALLREIRLRARLGTAAAPPRFARTLGRPSRAASHNATTAAAPRLAAFSRSCCKSTVASRARRSGVQSWLCLDLKAIFPKCMSTSVRAATGPRLRARQSRKGNDPLLENPAQPL